MKRGIRDATIHAHNLRSIRISRHLFSSSSVRVPLSKNLNNSVDASSHSPTPDSKDAGNGFDEAIAREMPFSIFDAQEMMLRPNSSVRQVTVEQLSFKVCFVHPPSTESSYISTRENGCMIRLLRTLCVSKLNKFG